MISPRFHAERHSCHICKEKIGKVVRQVEQVTTPPACATSPRAKKVSMTRLTLQQIGASNNNDGKQERDELGNSLNGSEL